MFQYATARSLAKRNRAELVLDTWSGFVRDYKFKRQFEIGVLPIKARKARFLERLPFWIDRINNKILKKAPREVHEHWYGVSLNETRFKFLPHIFDYQMRESCWMTGYWQSGKYFSCHESLIQKELFPPVPSESNFLELGEKMRVVNSVALGIRLYEEGTNPGAISVNDQLKSIESINNACSMMVQKQQSCHFFVFCTHKSSLLGQLQLRGDVTFITPEDGYEGTLQCFWLLTQCRHHIMTNSSYYWWGAWLSRKHYIIEEQTVYAADNFLNKDSVLHNWNLF